MDVLAGWSEAPAHLDCFGPITAAPARELAALARFVEQRDGTCRFPGCQRAAQHCDLDHTVPYPHGPTSADNLHALCRRHHRLKHQHPGTGIARAPDGTLTWTLPTGHHYRDEPLDVAGSRDLAAA